MKKVKLAELKSFCVKALETAGVSTKNATVAADVLITTDTFGVLTHGTKNLGQYIQKMHAGEIFVNGGIGSEFAPHAGAKQSGIGCDKSKHSLEEYYDIKFLSLIP